MLDREFGSMVLGAGRPGEGFSGALWPVEVVVAHPGVEETVVELSATRGFVEELRSLGNAASQVTALDAITVGSTQYVAAAWCGPCNPTFPSGAGFKAGVVMLSNSGGTWHATAQECTGSSGCPAAGLPNRYITGIKIDTANPNHGYLSLSGYSRHWIIGPDDPGVGHVYQTTTGGTAWTDVSGNLPDLPTNDIALNGSRLIAASDNGVYTSADNGSTWSRLGTNLPNVVVSQILIDPNGDLIAATHGRGLWTIHPPAP